MYTLCAMSTMYTLRKLDTVYANVHCILCMQRQACTRLRYLPAFFAGIRAPQWARLLDPSFPPPLS